MIALILSTIDHCSQWKSMRSLEHLIGEDSASRWNDMISYLYLLLGMSPRDQLHVWPVHTFISGHQTNAPV